MGLQHLLFVGDIHCGSTLGLLSEGFVTLEGNEVKQTDLQKWLWQCWHEMQADVSHELAGDPFGLVWMGDLIEGMHHGSTQVVSPDAGDHAAIAVACMRGLTDKAEKTFGIEGTECHTRNIEHNIYRSLGCIPDPETGKPAWPMLRMDICGSRVHASHHIGTTARPYLESSQFSPTLNSERIWAVRHERKIPDLVVRAHRHVYGQYRDNCGALVVTPCWQGLTRFGHKVVSGALPECGAVLVSWEREDQFVIRDFLYRPRFRASSVYSA